MSTGDLQILALNGNPTFSFLTAAVCRVRAVLGSLRDKWRIGRKLEDDQILKYALMAPIRQPIEGSRYRIGDLLFEYPDGGGYRRYLICGIQSGGLANVYTAVELESLRPVCIKENREKDGDAAHRDGRLREEGAIAARLSGHRNITRLITVFEHRRRVCLVYEFVPGRTLGRYVRNNGPNTELAIGFARDICRALCFAAARIPGFVHGDIKPGNCLLTLDGSVKLADFGHSGANAEVFNAGSSTGVRRLGGTNSYLPPEMFAGGVIERLRVDIFSFGATFLELLAGSNPFGFERETATLDDWAAAHSTARSMLERSDADEVIRSLILDCLALSPNDRPANFRAVAARLGAEPDEYQIDHAPEISPRTAEPRSTSARQRLKRDPFDVPAALELADQMLATNNPARIRLLRHVVHVDLWNQTALTDLSLALAAAGRRDEAERWAETAFERGVDDPRIVEMLVGARAARNDHSAALKIARTASESSPENSELRSLYGTASQSFVENLCGRSNDFAGLSRRLGQASGDMDAAFIDELIATEPSTPSAAAFVFAYGPFVAAIARTAGDDRRKKLSAWAEAGAVARDSAKFDADYGFGRFFYELEMFDECRRLFAESENRRGMNSDSRYFLGACHEIRGELSLAREFYRQGSKLDPTCRVTRAGLARVHDRLPDSASQPEA